MFWQWSSLFLMIQFIIFESILVFNASTASLFWESYLWLLSIILWCNCFSANSILFIISWSSLLSSLKISSSFTFYCPFSLIFYLSWTFAGTAIGLLYWELIFCNDVIFLLMTSYFFSYSFFLVSFVDIISLVFLLLKECYFTFVNFSEVYLSSIDLD